MLPAEMTAIAITQPGAPDVLKTTKCPVPHPKGREVLVRVHAAGVNRPDVVQRQGLYPPPQGASPFPGLEIAGEIVACGPQAKTYQIGTPVTALLAGGGYAEFAVVDETNALPIPQGYNFVQAAAIPETFFTVWSNLFDRGRLQAGETLLVHGGTSGIGTVAIQLAKAFKATVIATAGSAQKCQACLDLKADLAIQYNRENFVDKVLEFTQKKGANIILDMVGGDYVHKNYKAAAIEGRIVQIAFLNGNMATINLNTIAQKRLIHTGSTLRNRDIRFKADIAHCLQKNVWPLLESGQVKPIIDQVYDFTQADQAHAHIEQGGHIGKIMLKMI